MAPLHAVFAIGFSCLDVFIVRAYEPWLMPWAAPLPALDVALVRSLFINVTSYVVVVAVTHALLYSAKLREREVAAAQLEAQLTEARLHALQSQLRPHFLFNTLNTIAEQVHTDPGGADRMITRLGALLRASFDGAGEQEVALHEELALLDHYIAIMRVRFRDRVTFDVRADRDALDALVPRLVLQPLVENAVIHGIEPVPDGGRVEIVAWRRADLLVIEVRDDGRGVRGEPRGHGVGLRNTRDRLRQLYGESASRFVLRGRVGGGAIAALSIPYRPAPAPRAAAAELAARLA